MPFIAIFAEMKSSFIWTFIALVSFASGLVVPYVEGCSNSLWFPGDLLPLLLLFVSCIVLLSGWIRSIVSKRHVVATGLMLLISLLFFCASFMLRPADLFHLGFNHYAKTVLTSDEWRSISRFAQDHLKPEGQLPGPNKNLWNEKEHRALWSELTAATQIQKLDPSLMIFVRPGETEIVWGGALAGHRSIIIFTHKGDQSPRVSFIADDIATYISAD